LSARAFSSVPTRPIAVMPASLASCTAALPRPPDAEPISTLWPGTPRRRGVQQMPGDLIVGQARRRLQTGFGGSANSARSGTAMYSA
jgi:hypothetical protein